METLTRQSEAFAQTPTSVESIVDYVRSRPPEEHQAIRDRLRVLELSPQEARKLYHGNFVDAVWAQKDAIDIKNEEARSAARKRADLLSYIAGQQGIANRKIENDYKASTISGRGPKVSAAAYKISQVIAALKQAEADNDPELSMAVSHYCKAAFGITTDSIDVASASERMTLSLLRNLDRMRNINTVKRRSQQLLGAVVLFSLAGTTTAAASQNSGSANSSSELYEIEESEDITLGKHAKIVLPVIPSVDSNESDVIGDDIDSEIINASPRANGAARTIINPVVPESGEDEPEIIALEPRAPGRADSITPIIPEDFDDSEPEHIESDRSAPESSDDEDRRDLRELNRTPESAIPEDEDAPEAPESEAPSDSESPEDEAAPEESVPEREESTPEAPVEPEVVPDPAPQETAVDPSRADETMWTTEQLELINQNYDAYSRAEAETGVPWEVMAALHDREFSLKRVNPDNGQGIFQLYTLNTEQGLHFEPGPVSVEEFAEQAVLAADFLKYLAHLRGYEDVEISLDNPNVIKDILFSYNGRAEAYHQQALKLGHELEAEGSPYVMNLADDERNNAINPEWKQILTDGGSLGPANQAPGAWLLIEGLMTLTGENEGAALPVVPEEAPAPAPPESETEPEIEPFSIAPVDGYEPNSHFGPRGDGGMHYGIDYPAPAGTPFKATTGGKVTVLTYDASENQFCIDTLASLGHGPEVMTDPIQKEVWVTTTIGDDEYVTVYTHLSEVDVAPNQIVKPGEVVGKTGGSGCSIGEHAHYEVRKNGVPIDPASLHGIENMSLMSSVIDVEVPTVSSSSESTAKMSSKTAPTEVVRLEDLQKQAKKLAQSDTTQSKIKAEAKLRALQSQQSAKQK